MKGETFSKPFGNLQTGQKRLIHPLFVYLACSVILLPAHPSLQSFFSTIGVPSFTVAAVLALPLCYVVPQFRWSDRRIFKFVLPFAAYIIWMLLRGLSSDSIGESNFLASMRSLSILMPLSMFCALVAARNPLHAARIIFALGLISVAHYFYLIISGNFFSEFPGFRSLSDNQDRENYQSTSFYFGLVVVLAILVSLRFGGFSALVGIIGSLTITALMGMVGARSALVAVAICAVFFILYYEYYSKLLWAIGFSLFLAIFFSLYQSALFDSELIGQHFIVIDRFISLIEDEDSSGREWLFKSAISMWLDTPINLLFGGGLSSFPKFIGMPGDEGWYPHNFILESLAEGGIVAGLLLFWSGSRLLTKFSLLKFHLENFEFFYLGALAVYVIAAYQFMGGIQTLWIPTFFVALFIFSSSKYNP